MHRPIRAPAPSDRRISTLSQGPRPAPRLGLVLTLILGAIPVGAATNPWAGLANPGPGPARVIGEASAGCVDGAVALPATGVGFLTTQRARHRFFGHPELASFLEELGAAVDRHTGKRMVVGDLSQPRGGPMPNRHRSHQSGIDADVWLWLAPPQRSEPDEAPSMVLEGDDQVDPQRWGSEQVWLAKAVASHPAVDRIFVNAAIKAALCNEAGSDRRWLQKIRPWWHHRAHLHVRLRCPSDSPDCIAPPALPAGDGCGSELAWWFTDQAKAPRPPAKTPVEKPLPKECRVLLTENRRR